MGWTTIPAGDHFTFHTWDEGQGNPVVFLHGFEGHPGEDASFLHELAKNRRVIAPELPGCGDSEGFDYIEETLDMTLAIRQFIEALGVDRVDVIGHSLGGMFAAELAAVSPHVVNRVMLVSPFGLWFDQHPVPDLFVLNPTQLAEITWSTPGNATSVARETDTGNGTDQITATLNRTGNLAVATKFLWPIPDRGLRKRLPLIKAKTLVVRGNADQLIPAAYTDAFTDAIPGASGVTINNAGHYPMLEQPDEFVRTCEGFLA